MAGPRWRGVVLPLVLCGLSIASCRYLAFDRELQELRTLGTVRGTAESGDEALRPTVVLVYVLRELDTPLYDYVILLRPGAFEFTLEPGRYVLAAFEDRNGDFAHQPGEPLGYAGLDDPIELPEAGTVEGVAIRMSAGEGSRPGLLLDLSHPSADAELSPARRNVGVVATLDDPRFSRESGSEAFLRPQGFVREGAASVFFLEPYDPGRIPVLFVHGILGSPQDVRPLIESLDRERFQAWFFSYPSGLRLEILSGFLAEAVRELGVTFDLTRLYVVAHSMGGLVSRAFINSNVAEKKRELVQVFVTFATPFGGNDSARGARYLGERAELISWIDLVPSSAFLHDLYRDPLPDYVRHHLFFAYLKGSSEDRVDGVVSLTSQLDPRAREGARQLHPIEATHVGVLSDAGALEAFHAILEGAWARDASALRPERHVRRTAPSLRSAEHFELDWSEREQAGRERRAALDRGLKTGLVDLGALLAEEPLREAVRAANRERAGWTEAEILELDDRWLRDGPDAAPTDAACNDRLALFTAERSHFAEVFITDVRGANVCQSNPTTDYLQSDEAWWQRTWRGRQVWHTALEYDESAGAFGVALHVPLAETEGGAPFGVAKAILRETP